MLKKQFRRKQKIADRIAKEKEAHANLSDRTKLRWRNHIRARSDRAYDVIRVWLAKGRQVMLEKRRLEIIEEEKNRVEIMRVLRNNPEIQARIAEQAKKGKNKKIKKNQVSPNDQPKSSSDGTKKTKES